MFQELWKSIKAHSKYAEFATDGQKHTKITDDPWFREQTTGDHLVGNVLKCKSLCIIS